MEEVEGLGGYIPVGLIVVGSESVMVGLAQECYILDIPSYSLTEETSGSVMAGLQQEGYYILDIHFIFLVLCWRRGQVGVWCNRRPAIRG